MHKNGLLTPYLDIVLSAAGYIVMLVFIFLYCYVCECLNY